MTQKIRPLADPSEFLTEELDDELLVFDEQRQLACRLNRTAALVWENCDGERDVAELVEVLHDELGELADEDLVMVTLDRLDEHGLLKSGYIQRSADEARFSRRRFIRRVGVVGTAALALPVVQSIVAPASAAAQSMCHVCYSPSCGCTISCYCEGCYGEFCTECSACNAPTS